LFLNNIYEIIAVNSSSIFKIETQMHYPYVYCWANGSEIYDKSYKFTIEECKSNIFI